MNQKPLISLAVGIGVAFLAACNDTSFTSPAVEPIAVITGPETGLATTLIEVYGDESFDPNAAPADAPGIGRWRWTLVSAPPGSLATVDRNPNDSRIGELQTDLAGEYVVGLEVRDNNERLWSVQENWTIQIMPITGFFAELTWITDVNDVDMHLVNLTQGGGLFDDEFDCHFQNLRPDWGIEDDPTDDPYLSLDDVDGYGPEVAELAVPIALEDYGFIVHYFSDDGFGPTDATVKIYVNANLELERTRTMQANEVWDVANLTWDGAQGTVNVVDTLSVY